MATIEYSLLCESVTFPPPGFPCSALSAGQFPAESPNISVVVQLRGGGGEVVPLRVQILQPDGTWLLTRDQSCTLSKSGVHGGLDGVLVNLPLGPLPFATPGVYEARISLDGVVRSTHQLVVVQE